MLLFLDWDQVGSGTGAFRPPIEAAALCHACSVAHRFNVLKCPRLTRFDHALKLSLMVLQRPSDGAGEALVRLVGD